MGFGHRRQYSYLVCPICGPRNQNYRLLRKQRSRIRSLCKSSLDKEYHYEQHILPHDVQVKELGTGKSRLETLDALGIRNIEIAPKLAVEDGIQAARTMIPKCWFDADNCTRGVEALRQYRRDFDEKLKTWRGRPLHDWTSHGADAFRYLAVGYRSQSDWGEPIRRNLRGIA